MDKREYYRLKKRVSRATSPEVVAAAQAELAKVIDHRHDSNFQLRGDMAWKPRIMDHPPGWDSPTSVEYE